MSVLLALLLATTPAPAPAGPSVTIPLEEWEKLRDLRERPSLTVVELLRVEGSFTGRDLAMSFSGRATGRQPAVEVLDGVGYRVFACEGDALLSRGVNGSFTLTPLGPRFRVRCRVALDGSDRLEAAASAAVLEVASAVGDGELVASDGVQGARIFTVVRRIAGEGRDLPPSVAGRYRLTLLPEESRFHYLLQIRNPNRAHRRFELALRDVEHVETVDAAVAWDAEGGRYRFDLPPGESTVALSGRFTGSSFSAPVDATLQYLLLESHPLIRPDVRTEAKRVGVAEVGLPATYRGAQAFLLDGGAEVAWQATRLEALKTAGLAVGSLQQVFFLGVDGKARGQASFQVDNQGAPALVLPLDGEPTFASVGGEAAFLTRDAEGRLLLPLSQGVQEVAVQDARPFSAGLGFAVARLDLPRVGVPASRATVELRYPEEWIPVYEELPPAVRLHLLQAGQAVLLAALAVALERLLALLALTRRRRVLLAALVVLAAAFSRAVLGWALFLSGGALLALLVLVIVRRVGGARLPLVLAGVGAAGIVALSLGSVLWERVPQRASVAASNVAKLYEFEDGTVGGVVGGVASPAASPAPRAARQGYQGLPARIELPEGARRTTFSREMLPGDGPRRATVVLAAARLVAALTWATLLAALGVAFVLRRDLVRGARELVARVGKPAA